MGTSMKKKKEDPFLTAINFITKEATPAQLNLLELAVSHGKELRKPSRL